MLKSKTTLASGETIDKVITTTSNGEIYEATPEEIANAGTPSAVYGALASNLTLEQSSNPAFTVNNRGAAELYQAQMGGYMMLVKDGKVYAAKLNGSNWNYFADGTEVADASLFETMVRVPQCHVLGVDKTLHFGGLTPIDGGHVFDSPGWVGAYKMYVDSAGQGHSRPDVAPSHSKTMSAFQTAAQKTYGSQWGQANYGFFCLINALCQARYGNLNSQATIGAGFQHSNWEAARNVPMGLTRSLGDGSGKVLYNDDTLGNQYPVKLFGFEDLWGKLWEFRPGIRFYMDDDNVRHAVVYSGNVVSNTAEGRDFVCSVSSASNAYVKSMKCGEYWDMIAEVVSGASSTTYYCDAYWAATGGQLLVVGGSAHYGASCGVSCAGSNHGFSSSWPSFGSRLAFYGEAEIVSGADLVAMTV